jgi:microcystin-dependent protein
MATCTGDQYVENIERTECIGNSLVKINNNFKNLDVAVCETGNDIEGLISLITSLSAAVQSSGFTGCVSYFPSTVAPTGWLALSGQQVSRTEYSNLWSFAQSSGNLVTNTNWTSLSAFGSFSDGDGSTTFRLPDLRGHFVRGSGTHTDGTAAGAFGRKQADEFKSHNHSFSFRTDTVYGGMWPNSGFGGGATGRTTGSAGGTETRPKNIALLYCIKF